MPALIGHSKLSGSETILLHDAALSTTVLAFWSWALSDVVSNTARGLPVEFFVACDLDVIDAMRIEWVPFDLPSRGGLRVEVKSSVAYGAIDITITRLAGAMGVA